MTDSLLVPCSECGSTNRAATEKLGEGLQARCGKCKAELPAIDKPITVTDATFAQLVEQSPLPMVVDVWASWCGPCVALAPTIDQLAKEFAGKIRFGKLNYDENPEIPARFAIRGIPALLVYKDGKEVDRIVGLQPKAALVAKLSKLLA